MKIIHISDLHYPKTGSKTKKLTENIISHYSNVETKPIIVLSGDILESSFNKRYFRQAKRILKKLPENNFKILICPGNHDMKIKGIGPIIRGRKRFNAFFKSLLPTNNYYGEEDNNLLDFPLVHKFDNHFFIGLDSLAEGSGVFANGNLGYSQLDELEETLSDIRSEHSDAKIIIYLHNNPFKFGFKYEKMKLLDAKKFLKIITGVDVLLFGHLHRNKRYVEEEQKYDINCIQLTGASTFPRSESYKVEWIELDTELSTTTSIKY